MRKKPFQMPPSLTDFGPKKPGHCTQCGEFLWDREDDYRGRSGKRATFMLANGTVMDLTMCDECLEDLDLEKIWFQVLAGWRGGNADAVREDIAQAVNTNFVLALLYTQEWRDVDNEQKIAL